MANPYGWSKNLDTTNGNVDGDINWQENQPPSSVNDSARNQMASHARFYDALFGANTSTGGALSYALTTELVNPTITYRAGMQFAFKAHITCGASATLNVDGQGARKLYGPDLTEVTAGFFKINQLVTVYYDPDLDSSTGGFVVINAVGDYARKSENETITGFWQFPAGTDAANPSFGLGDAQTGLRKTASELIGSFEGVDRFQFDPPGVTAGATLSVITREKGDERYTRPDNAEIVSAQWRFQDILTVGNATTLARILLDRNDGGAPSVGFTAAAPFLDIPQNGTSAARVYPAGTAATDALTTMTREKGDARYTQVGDLIAIIQDRKTAGTAGQTPTAGSFITQELNNILYNKGGNSVTLASNEFTPAVDCLCTATWSRRDSGVVRIYNVTDAAFMTGKNYGTTGGLIAYPGVSEQLEASKTYRLEFQTNNASPVGAAGSDYIPVYAEVHLWAT